MEVFIGDMNTPALRVSELKRPLQTGSLTLSGKARFANFRYTPLQTPTMVVTPNPSVVIPTGTITRWQVSTAFAEKSLQTTRYLSDAHKKNLNWQTLPTEQTGLLNLATGPKFSKVTNTTFARVVLFSEKDQLTKLQLGFSDRARVFLNDQILYCGNDKFRSRDYRFLGTVGYFDELYLPLKQGRNELWIAISEDFGGWGIKGLLEASSSIRIEPL